MKKTMALLIAFCTLLSLFSCNKDEGKKPTGGAEKGEVVAWTTHLTDKQIANIKPNTENKTNEYDVYMTRGESEGCQLLIYSPEQSIVTVKITSGENDSISTGIFVMDRTVKIQRKEYTDPAVPYSGTRMKLEAKKVVPFIAEFTTTADTPAGDYKYTYEIYDTKGKKVLAEYTVNVHVWDIVMPTEKTFATAIDLRAFCIKGMGDTSAEAYERYYNLLLEHNFSSYNLPYDILDERADAYMSDPRVTSFVVGLWDAADWDENTLLAYYNKLKTNPVWLDKAMFYIIDEPEDEEDVEEYNALAKRLQALCPGIEMIAPFYTNIDMGGKDQVDVMAKDTALWCPKLCLWDDVNAYEEITSFTPGKTFAERMKEFQAEGDTVWAYVCNHPVDPYAQLFIDTDGIVQRLMMWQCYRRDIEGFLYWGANAYEIPEGKTEMVNPWETPANGISDGGGVPVYGEGYIVYPGSRIGLPGAVPTNRLKILRDGIDDIEILTLAEKHLDAEWLASKVAEAAPTLTTYASEEAFYKLRKEIGDALEKALAGKQ